ncbi:hypothetical protein M758_6G085100 [Ceratodon purpureus]|nr:hypothetical protein M758_6G085100 [Ceratodon purpureus]
MDPEKKQIPCYLTCVEGEHWSRLLQCCPPMSSNTVLAPVVSVFFAASVPVHVQLVSGHARASPLTGLVLAALSSSPWSCATSSCIEEQETNSPRYPRSSTTEKSIIQQPLWHWMVHVTELENFVSNRPVDDTLWSELARP